MDTIRLDFQRKIKQNDHPPTHTLKKIGGVVMAMTMLKNVLDFYRKRTDYAQPCI